MASGGGLAGATSTGGAKSKASGGGVITPVGGDMVEPAPPWGEGGDVGLGTPMEERNGDNGVGLAGYGRTSLEPEEESLRFGGSEEVRTLMGAGRKDPSFFMKSP